MSKSIEHSHNEKKKAQHSLKEKRALKEEKRAAKRGGNSTVTPDMLS